MTASVLLGVSACSGLTTPHSGPSAASTADVAPVQFDTSAAVALPAQATKFNTALYQKTAYIHTPEGVVAFDTVTAKSLGPITAPHQLDPAGADKTSKPISGTVDGTDVILVVVPVTVPGQTVPNMLSVDVLLIDAVRGTLIRAVTAQVPRPAADRPLPRAVTIVSGDLILNNSGSTYRISLADGTIRWTASDIETVTTGDNGSWLIGATSRNQQAYARGINAENGETVWTDPAAAGTRISFNSAGPRFVVITSENFTKVVNSATGATAATAQFPLGTDFRCFYDQLTTAICSAPGIWTSAVDTATGQWLWQHTADSGAFAKLTSAWHGLAYGTTVSGPAMLDARTGTQRLPAAAVAPLLVNGHVGIAEADRGLRAYPAAASR